MVRPRSKGGLGVFYDALFTNILDNTQATSPNSVASAFNAAGTTRGIANWSSYLSQLPISPDAHASVDSQVAHLLSPEILQWNFNIQRELPGRFTLEIGYLGTVANTCSPTPLPTPSFRVAVV